MAPEAEARAKIDVLLELCGWSVQDYTHADLSAGQGVALREVPLKSGRCDYLLIVDRVPVGIIEAKKEGSTLSGVAAQSDVYARNLPDFLHNLLPAGIERLPFLYESTGIETFFRDERDPHPRSRRLFAFHRPAAFVDWLGQAQTLRARLVKMPFAFPLVKQGMRQCQIEAITGLETSFAAMIQMATGAGKTFDFIVTYEGHRSIYGDWRQVLEAVVPANLRRAGRLWQAVLQRTLAGRDWYCTAGAKNG